MKTCSSLEDTRRNRENTQIPRPKCVEVLFDDQYADGEQWVVGDGLTERRRKKRKNILGCADQGFCSLWKEGWGLGGMIHPNFTGQSDVA